VKRIAVFASGAGSNAQNLIEYFELHRQAQVTLVVCNNPNAGVVKIAQEYGVEVLLIDKGDFFDKNFPEQLHVRGIDLIVLAGFLWLIPPALIQFYSNRIINIHPSLLPKFGGKGMYGKRVHEAVLAAGEKESGITIHFVNEHFDEGKHIAQFNCEVNANDTIETLSARIHQLEHDHLPKVVEGML
jgi:phosphoribosylglycinamide formyltransferase 1